MHQLTLRTLIRPSLRHLNTSLVARLVSPTTKKVSFISGSTRHVPSLNRNISNTAASRLNTSPSHMNNPGKSGSGGSSGKGSSGNNNMNLKNVSVGLVASSLVLGGAVWLSQRGGGADDSTLSSAVQSPTTTPIPPPTAISPDHDARAATPLVQGPPQPAMQKVVAVDEESLYTASLPIDKKIEDSGGKKVVAMLSPEEATAKLRANEESYNVGRGTGVWRYDVVQIPSNNPIEDDHAEKIIEVPAAVAQPYEGKDTSDWMFWGVFDGHRYGIHSLYTNLN